MQNEIWKDIPGLEGYYQASNLGRIRSLDVLVKCRNNNTRLKKGRILRQTPYKNGYLSVILSKDNKVLRRTVHRIVAITFIPNIENKPCVDHINAVISDNRVSNLRWVTYSENNMNPIHRKRISISKKGENCFFYGKTFNCKPIISIDPNGNIVKYQSIAEAARAGFTYRGIQDCLSGLYKYHKNCKWLYYDDFKDTQTK